MQSAYRSAGISIPRSPPTKSMLERR
ncbi:hypothetical protein [Micromonospora sp. CPCC 205558]